MADELTMTRARVRGVDSWAIEILGVSGLVLMENAGRCAADVAAFMVADTESPCVAVLAGAGNNAGDGFVVVRHLSLRGIATEAFLLAPPGKIRGDARANLSILTALGHTPANWCGLGVDEMTQRLSEYDLVVDSLGGTGIVGTLRGDVARAVNAANAADTPILAIDIPTGLNCDTGLAEGPAIQAASTVTFVARKVGFDAPGAADYTGQIVVADIGVPADLAPFPTD